MLGKIVTFKAKFPKSSNFQGILFFASFSLQKNFFAKIFFACKDSLFVIQYIHNISCSRGNSIIITNLVNRNRIHLFLDRSLLITITNLRHNSCKILGFPVYFIHNISCSLEILYSILRISCVYIRILSWIFNKQKSDFKDISRKILAFFLFFIFCV